MAKIFNSIFGIENLESLVEYAFLSMILGLEGLASVYGPRCLK